ncbi:hypothetical protein LguiB_012751 [Lonicera macranthoides]
MANRNSSRLLGHKKFEIHYDGYWKKKGAVNVDNFIGKSKTLGSVDGDCLSFMDLEKDIRDIYSDDLLLKLWEVMLLDDNNMYHIFVSTSIPPIQLQSKLNLNLNHENIPDAELEQMIEDIDETYEVITSPLLSDVTNDGYRYSSSETESEEGAD